MPQGSSYVALMLDLLITSSRKDPDMGGVGQTRSHESHFHNVEECHISEAIRRDFVESTHELRISLCV